METSIKVLSNESLKIGISALGAELCSIQSNDIEYLWQADPKFWKRHSPVLFPIVGSVIDGTFIVNGHEYKMSQHGFARDMEFSLISETSEEIWYRLSTNETTLSKYPYNFILEIGYKIEGKDIHVMWRVSNPSDEDIHFQIGAHPAFYYRQKPNAAAKGYFAFSPASSLQYILIKEKGCVDPSCQYDAQLDSDNLLPIVDNTFSHDALIFEHSQLNEVSLLDSNKTPYLKLRFDAPVVGLWAPSPESPFVCIEPWYGRCDRVNFKGEFKDRDWMQHLAPHSTFSGGYTISIL